MTSVAASNSATLELVLQYNDGYIVKRKFTVGDKMTKICLPDARRHMIWALPVGKNKCLH